MTDPDITDALLELLDRTLADMRAGRTIDLAAWREQFPEHIHHLPKLLETVQALETAVEDWRGAATLLETFHEDDQGLDSSFALSRRGAGTTQRSNAARAVPARR